MTRRFLYFYFILAGFSLYTHSPLIKDYKLQFCSPAESFIKDSVVNSSSQSSFIKDLLAFIEDYFKNPFKSIVPLPVTNQEKHAIIAHHLFKILEKDSTTILAPQVMRDLNLIYNAENRACCVLSSCIKASTASGTFFSAFLLTNPTVDVCLLRNRQSIIRGCVEREDVYIGLQDILNSLGQQEVLVADFFKNELNKNFHAKMLSHVYYSRKDSPLLSHFDNYPLYHQLNYMYDYISLGLTIGGIHPGKVLFGMLASNQISSDGDGIKKCFKRFPSYYKEIVTGKIMTSTGMVYALTHMIDDPSNFARELWNDKLGFVTFLGVQSYYIWSSIQDFNFKKRVIDFIHVKMNGVANFIRNVQRLSHSVKQNAFLADNLFYADYLHRYTSDTSLLSGKMRNLLEILETDTFATESQWALRGRVLSAYKIFEEIKEELATVLVAIGEIDAYVSVAQLYKDRQNTYKPFTFVDYNDCDDNPFIKLQGMWNPLVMCDYPVVNSIVLGKDNYPRNAVTTGPNAGGKTTFLKGIGIAMIWAQSFAIAPAEVLEFTPFATINTSMGIVDNIAAGQSLFMSQVRNLFEVMQTTIANDAQENFTLSLIDELFSGTSPEHGAAASYAVAKKLGSMTTSINLISTHFAPVMTTLESKTSYFKNYKVKAHTSSDGSLLYSYAVEPGINYYNAVDSIFTTIGFDAQVMKDFEDQLSLVR